MATSIDALAGIAEIAADLEASSAGGGGGYNKATEPPKEGGQLGEFYRLTPQGVPISLSQIKEASKVTPSTKFGAGIASYVPANKMLSKVGGKPPLGESAALFPSGKFEQPLINVRSDIKTKMDREFLNDVWRHEYRHMGMGLLQQSEEQTWGNKLSTLLSGYQGRPRYFTPINTAMNKVFKPGYSWSGGLVPRPYGLGYAPGQSLSSEELTNRYMDFKYGLSDEYNKQIRKDLQKYSAAGFYDISSDDALRSLIEKIQKQAEGL